MNIGPYILRNNVFVAPMAGVTDRPFRQLCKELGTGYAVSEMAASNPRLWQTEKTSRRINHDREMEPRAVQIAGCDPQMLAECAKYNVDPRCTSRRYQYGVPSQESLQQLVRFGLVAG